MKITTTRTSSRRRARGPRRVLLALVLLGSVGLLSCGGGSGDDAESAADTAARAEAPAAGSEGSATADGALLNPNRASAEELRGLAGLSDAGAQSLLDGRPFANMIAVDAALAPHLDAAAREELYRRMWIPLSLNDASDEEILLVPGVGDRMLHEFREYRPYRSMEQFRREIGKYVTDEELARLERFVRLDG